MAILAAAGTISMPSTIRADEATPKDTMDRYAPCFPLYSCKTSQHQDLAPLMKDFSHSFGGKAINALERNPRCCVWFEIVGAANPGTDGWYVWHQAGGTIITATDMDQMKVAIEALNRIAKTENEQRVLPIGITTCFPVTQIT
jgi:hypothetical protein